MSDPTTPSTVKVAVILNGPGDWRLWFAVVRTAAKEHDIWEYIDPEVEETEITEPSYPTPQSVNNTKTLFSQLSEDEKADYQRLTTIYNRETTRYDRRRRGLAAMMAEIQRTVSKSYQEYILEEDTPRGMILALKTRLAPTDERREEELITLYRELQRAPRTSGIEEWLRNWESVYSQCKKLNIPDVQKSRAVKDFIRAVKPLSEEFSNYWINRLDEMASNDKPDLYNIVDRFRRQQRDAESLLPSESKISFATFKGKGNDDQLQDSKEPEEHKENQKTCQLCDGYHDSSRCFYIRDKDKRPRFWKPNPETDQRIRERLEKDPKFRNIVEKIKRTSAKQQPRSRNPKETDDNNVTFATSLQEIQQELTRLSTYSTSASNKVSYSLKNSYLLDSASTIHVCNDRSRFSEYRDINNESLLAGDTEVSFKGLGTIEVKAKSVVDERKVSLELKDVIYAPTFHTNIVSYNRAMNKGIYWNSEPDKQFLYHLHSKVPICKVFPKNDQWLLEYNPIINNTDNSDAVYSTEHSKKPKHLVKPKRVVKTKRSVRMRRSEKAPSLKGSMDLWHKRMGHLNKEAIRHLPEVTEGVIITGKRNTDELEPLCEACNLSEIPRQISRRPMPRGTRPCERIHLDLIPFKTGYNGDQHAIHMFCDVAKMNWIDTMPTKGCALTCLQNFVKLVENVWKCKVQRFHLDGETALRKKFNKWAAKKGIAIERSPPYTPEQNGIAERSGGVISRKARTMMIEALLPENLWPEAIRTATHLMNRTPLRQLGWKTPLQVMNELTGISPSNRSTLPNLGYIRIFGCRAYAKEFKIPKLEKMRARAQIGYLVGYDSSNIFRIWNPRKNTVSSTRDVKFDEARKFDPKSPYAEDELLEAIHEPTVLIEVPSIQDTYEEVEPITQEPLTRLNGPTVSSELQVLEKKERTKVLPTPESTPDREANFPIPMAPSREISADISESNIIEGPRTRKRSDRRQAYLADLQNIGGLPALYSTFATGTMASTKRYHRDELPPPPKSWAPPT
jgi:hypothetical protein